MNIRKLHPASKILIIIIIGFVTYIVASSMINLTATDILRGLGRGRMMDSLLTGNVVINTTSIASGLIGMLIASLLIFRRGHDSGGRKDDFSIMKRALTEGETSLLENVRAVPDGITQDSLRFRLGWSKAKVSTMLGNLDRMGLVQRERFGKTYKVYYQETDGKK